MTYRIPPKIEKIVRENAPEVKRLLRSDSGEGCPLEGYAFVVTAWGVVAAGSSCSDTLPGEVFRVSEQGCYALRDDFCYLRRASKQVPRVPCKERCPVYGEVLRVIREE